MVAAVPDSVVRPVAVCSLDDIGRSPSMGAHVGKHTRKHSLRSHRKPSATRRVAASTATAAMGTAAAGAIIASGHHPVQPPQQLVVAAPAANVTVEVPSLHAVPVRQSAWVTVKEGETLSGIAGENCPTEADWTGTYVRNKKVIGSNPDVIQPGQVLAVDCRVVNLPVVTTAYVQPHHHHYAAPRPAVIHARIEGGTLSFAGLEALWDAAGGPAWAARSAAAVAECESGGNSHAYNPSGASGLWQILGQVVGGYIFDPYVNARNAVSKFEASGDTWAQWVCKP